MALGPKSLALALALRPQSLLTSLAIVRNCHVYSEIDEKTFANAVEEAYAAGI